MKLNSNIRVNILAAVMRHRFAEDCIRHVADLSQFYRGIYDEVYTQAQQDQMAKLPAGWLPEVAGITVQFGGPTFRHYVHFNGAEGTLTYTIRMYAKREHNDVLKRVPYKHSGYGNLAKVFPTKGRIAQQFQDLKKAEKQLLADMETARTAVKGALKGSTTIGGLVKAWPEVAPFIPKDLQTTTALAVPADKLNKLLGLEKAS